MLNQNWIYGSKLDGFDFEPDNFSESKIGFDFYYDSSYFQIEIFE